MPLDFLTKMPHGASVQAYIIREPVKKLHTPSSPSGAVSRCDAVQSPWLSLEELTAGPWER